MDIQPQPVGCCGHDCSRCKIYLATVHDDEQLRQESKQFYRDAFSADLPLHTFHCLGCRSEDVFALCRDCPFTVCADRHGVTHCADCAEYPCPALTEYQKTYVNRCNQIPPTKPTK
ncbi:MAG: DUF3795 domain-containing protein [Clostridia bacterium]|nr:DUF3795 domain-containing protein [Clostridia bacterium]